MKAIVRREQGGESDTNRPHGEKIKHGGTTGVTSTHKDTHGHDAGGETWFCPSLDAQALGSQLSHSLIGCQRGHHQRRGHVHDGSHEGHHRHAQQGGHPCETNGQAAATCTKTLADQRGCSFADTVAGHIAKTLGRDAEGIGSNGNSTQRSHDDRDGNLGHIHQHTLQEDRTCDAAGLAQDGFLRDKGTATADQPKFRTTGGGIPHQIEGYDTFGRDRTNGCTRHAEPCTRQQHRMAKEVHRACGEDE